MHFLPARNWSAATQGNFMGVHVQYGAIDNSDNDDR
jgi:hypothetical protein